MSFAFILFGDGKATICNTNCRNISLLETLKQICHKVCDQNDQLDLADESGECKNLLRNLDGFASDVIAPRERLVLLRAEQTQTEPTENATEENKPSSLKFSPLLKSALNDQKFLYNLNQPPHKRRKYKPADMANGVSQGKESPNLSSVVGAVFAVRGPHKAGNGGGDAQSKSRRSLKQE